MTCKLTGKISPVGNLAGSLQNVSSLSGTLSKKLVDNLEYPRYSGETVFTPSSEEQIIDISHTVVLENIVINPIPSNYGLVTWNGSTLTIS